MEETPERYTDPMPNPTLNTDLNGNDHRALWLDLMRGRVAVLDSVSDSVTKEVSLWPLAVDYVVADTHQSATRFQDLVKATAEAQKRTLRPDPSHKGQALLTILKSALLQKQANWVVAWADHTDSQRFNPENGKEDVADRRPVSVDQFRGLNMINSSGLLSQARGGFEPAYARLAVVAIEATAINESYAAMAYTLVAETGREALTALGDRERQRILDSVERHPSAFRRLTLLMSTVADWKRQRLETVVADELARRDEPEGRKPKF